MTHRRIPVGHATDIVGYTFNASMYCGSCIGNHVGQYSGTTAEERLDNAANWLGIDRQDESSFDSSQISGLGEPADKAFPKVVFRSMLSEGDECEDCGQPLADATTGTDLLPGIEP